MTHEMSQSQKPIRLAVVLVMMIGAIVIRPVVSYNIHALEDASAETSEALNDYDVGVNTESITTEITPTISERNIKLLSSMINYPFDKPTETTKLALSLEELNSLGMLHDTNSIILATKIFLYQQKTRMSLKLVNKILSTIKSIQKDMIDLLNNNTSANLSSSQSMSQYFDTYKQADDALENKLTQAEGEMSENQHQIRRYVLACRGVEREWTGVYRTLGNILLSQSNFFQTLGELNDGNDGTPSFGTTTSQSPFIRTTGDPTVLFNCGGTLKSNNGSINYKFSTEEALSQSESCVWTVSTENGANLVLSLKALQFEQSALNFISVGYFVNAQYHEDSFTWQKFASAAAAPQKIEIPSPVAFVHFVTSTGIEANSKGFHLEFQTQTSNSSSLSQSYNFTNIFLTGSNGSRRYPLSGNYENSERTSIVVQPSLPDSSLTVTRYDFEASHDVLSIWMFESDLVWRRNGRFTGSNSTSRNFVRPDSLRNNPYILAFKSDGSVTSSGFAIEWSAA